MIHRWNRALILSTLAIRAPAFTGPAAFTTTKRVLLAAATTPPPRRATTTPGSSNFFSTTAVSMTKTVLVPIADGSEEIETTCITDTLTRFGAKVTIASVGPSLECRMSRGIKVMADCSISDCLNKEWDLIALPGGMPGAEHLRDSADLVSLLKKQKNEGKLYAAVCAAPAVALASHGLIDADAQSTCYPAPKFRDALPQVSHDAVVVSNNLITSQGPGTALPFALRLGEVLYGPEKREQIAKEMLVN